eukprot:CAMPEP_0172717436 /NCGR_PEP_ID=MMETSP1074-20121228/71429_1 /TAXON_ID=2916 /ORGANISM="Ceratium fusus, Strain PA161109" /LENGTH=47 /DNA_ID= /DNA_START= /DNA_END= /DNA_ORIENTATION=
MGNTCHPGSQPQSLPLANGVPVRGEGWAPSSDREEQCTATFGRVDSA